MCLARLFFNQALSFSLQHLESCGVSLMLDSHYSGQTRAQVLLEHLENREMELEDLATIRRIKLEQCVQLCQFEGDANQVRDCSLNNRGSE